MEYVLFIIGVEMVLVVSDFIENRYRRVGVMVLGLIFSSAACFYLGTPDNSFNKPLVPRIKIECLDKVCDTTYIYNFNKIEE